MSRTTIRRVLLIHNSPRVGRYFTRLRDGISDLEIQGCRVSARAPRGDLPEGTIDEIVDYGMRRKRARAQYGPARLAFFERVYRIAARLHYEHVLSEIGRAEPDALGVWGGNSVDAKAVVLAARHCDLPCFQFENGFLPNTTQMDLEGVNVESSVPRDPDFYRTRPGAVRRDLPDRIVPRAPRRHNRGLSAIPLPERYVFVPFQVQLDSQILLHSPWIQGMGQLFQVMTDAVDRSGAPVELVFKEHPSCPRRYPDLHERARDLDRVVFASGNSTDDLIRNALGVVTINSTVGTESMLLDRPVLALGNAVYEIPGVASSARSVDRVAQWLEAVWEDRPPEAPLRESFLRFLVDDFLIPDRHQDPGPAHVRAVEARFRAGDRVPWDSRSGSETAPPEQTGEPTPRHDV